MIWSLLPHKFFFYRLSLLNLPVAHHTIPISAPWWFSNKSSTLFPASDLPPCVLSAFIYYNEWLDSHFYSNLCSNIVLSERSLLTTLFKALGILTFSYWFSCVIFLPNIIQHLWSLSLSVSNFHLFIVCFFPHLNGIWVPRTWHILFGALILKVKTQLAFNKYLCKKGKREKNEKKKKERETA